MRKLRSFLRENAPWLAAGGLLTFGSSFGQTYFISIFAGEIRAEFGLSHGDWGGIYALGTFASAALMLLIGGVVDGYRTRSIAAINLVVFALVCLSMALVSAAWLLPVVIFGLRFCGQGMMSHLAFVSVGRWFAAQRGRAISITAMGFSIGEAVLPFTFVLLTFAIGWRGAWGIAALILLFYIPLIAGLLRKERNPSGVAEADQTVGMKGRHWRRKEALGHWLFWTCVPGLLSQPIFGTAYFFQQVHLVEVKGWTLQGFTSLFPVYTASAILALLLGGAAVDRWGVGRVMPIYLLPMVGSLLVMAHVESLGGAALSLAFFGVTQGIAGAVTGAFWPEYYGTKHLGAIRSVATSLMVFATALGPWGTGVLIDAGIDFRVQLQGMAAITLLSAAVYAFAFGRARLLLTTAS